MTRTIASEPEQQHPTLHESIPRPKNEVGRQGHEPLARLPHPPEGARRHDHELPRAPHSTDRKSEDTAPPPQARKKEEQWDASHRPRHQDSGAGWLPMPIPPQRGHPAPRGRELSSLLPGRRYEGAPTDTISLLSTWTWVLAIEQALETRAFDEVPLGDTAPWYWELVDLGQELVRRGADDSELTWRILRAVWEVEECQFLPTVETYMNGVVRALHLQSQRRERTHEGPPTEEEKSHYIARVVHSLLRAYKATAPAPEWKVRLAAGRVRMRLKRKPATKPGKSRQRSATGRGPEGEQDHENVALVAKKWVLKPRKTKQVYETSKQIWRSARPDRRTAETRRLVPGEGPRTLLSRRCSSHPWAMEEIEVEAETPDGATRTAAPAEGNPDNPDTVAVETESAHRLWLILLGLVPEGNTLGLTDIESLPMTLPSDIVGNVEETLSDQSPAELEELREALPEVLDRIKEEVLGLLDQASGSSSSAARPPEVEETATREEEPVDVDDTEDLTHLMQRTLTGTLKQKAHRPSETYLQLHQDLQAMPALRASALARQLRDRLQDRLMSMPEWSTLEAVLAANSEPATEVPTKEEASEQAAWVDTWLSRLPGEHRLGAGSGAASSWESPPSEDAPTVDAQLAEHEKELDAQNERDTALYSWHLQQAAAEAKRRDEAALQSYLGWSGGNTRKKLRLQIEVATEARTHYQEIEIGTGESINLKLTLTDSAPRMFRGGKPVHAGEARELIEQAESALLENQHPPPTEQYSLEDVATRELLEKWTAGKITSDEVARTHGRSMVVFLEECRETQATTAAAPPVPVSFLDASPSPTRRAAHSRRMWQRRGRE